MLDPNTIESRFAAYDADLHQGLGELPVAITVKDSASPHAVCDFLDTRAERLAQAAEPPLEVIAVGEAALKGNVLSRVYYTQLAKSA